VDAGEVFHVARQAVERLDDHSVEALGGGVAEQGRSAVAAEQRAAGAGAVLVDRRDLVALARGIGAAQRDLVVDGALVLEVAAEAGVDGGAFHLVSLIASSTFLVTRPAPQHQSQSTALA